jgi:Ca2+-binding RTX toxin-like protein
VKRAWCLVLCGSLAFLTSGLALAQAEPSSANRTNRWVRFEASADRVVDLVVSPNDGRLHTFTDRRGPVTPLGTCLAITESSVSCGRSGINLRVVGSTLGDRIRIDDKLHTRKTPHILGRGGSDVIVGGPWFQYIFGGFGSDVLRGGAGVDQIYGGNGADTLYGDGGGDLLVGGCLAGVCKQGGDTYFGGKGPDTLAQPPATGQPPGSDVLWGGGGEDQAWYSLRTADLSLTLDDVANDGEAGEGDDIRFDVERMVAGDGDDVLVGNDRDNRLEGGAGDDSISGLVGTDHLYGRGGNDEIQAQDGSADVVNCGPGDADHAIVDLQDSVTGCELVES